MTITKEDLVDRINLRLIGVGVAAVAAVLTSELTSHMATVVISFGCICETIKITFSNATKSQRSTFKHSLQIMAGVVVCAALIITALAAIKLRVGTNGLYWLLWPILVAIAADLGAYFGGKCFPSRLVSLYLGPGKTWSGLCFGTLAGATVGAGFLWVSGLQPVPTGLSLAATATLQFFPSACVAAAAMAGDLGGSALKRLSGVKDSSQLFGAHGGMLDRFNSHAVAIIATWALKQSF